MAPVPGVASMVFPRGRGSFAESGPLFDVMSPTTSTIRLDPDLSPKIGLHIRSDTNLNLPKAKSCWSKCVMYLHITILYVLLIILYSELKSTKKNIYDFNLAMLNLSAKHMELEMSCFREMSVLREALSGCGREMTRSKRQAAKKDESHGLTLPGSLPVDITGIEGEASSEFKAYGVIKLEHYPVELEQRNRKSVLNNARNRTLRSSSSHWRSRRGKHGAKRRSCKHSNGANLVHLTGGMPESVIRDGGLIAPWFIDKKASGDFGFSSIHDMKYGKGIIEIGESGLYLLYAQVYYLTNEMLNSFSIIVKEGGENSKETTLSTCSTAGIASSIDVSCFTSLVRHLKKGDWLFLRQRERNRKLLFRDGQTYFGITLISRLPPSQSSSDKRIEK